MWPVAQDRAFFVEVGSVGNQTRSKVDQSAQADPPGHYEEDSIVLDQRFVNGQEAEEDEHEAGCHDAEDAEGLPVAVLM